MEMGKKKQPKEVPDDNTYLVCPLSDDTIEAIRAEAYKSREKKTLAQERKAARLRKREIEKRDPKELRRIREAGGLLVDSSRSESDVYLKEQREFTEAFNNPLRYTQFVRREYYYKLSRKQMQRVLARYYGWEKWSEDPWGSYPKFCEWIDSARDNEMAVWAVNETLGGRVYLRRVILEGLGQLDYPEMTEKGLLTSIGYGAACFLYVKNKTGWDSFVSHYPKEPLPVRLVNEKVSKVYPFDSQFFHIPGEVFTKADGSIGITGKMTEKSFEGIADFFSVFLDPRNYGPLTSYRFLVSGIYQWYIALNGAMKQAKGHPELEGFLNYHTATDTQIAELCQKLGPKDYQLPDKNQSLIKLYQGLKGRLEAKEWKYSDVLEEGVASTWESLLTGVNHWKPQAYKATIAGLQGQLGNSLLSIVEHDFKDAAGKAYRKHEVAEAQIDATRLRDEEDITPFLDTRPSREPTPEELMLSKEPIDLKSLVLNIDELKPVERRLLNDVCDAANEDIPLTKYWGKDYTKKIRRLNRLRPKLKKL